MAIKELREKYGRNSGALSVLNRAVKAEIPGSVKVFEVLEALFPLRGKQEEYKKFYDMLQESVEEMRDFIAEKYELKTNMERKNGKGTVIDGQNGHQGLAGGSETGNP